MSNDAGAGEMADQEPHPRIAADDPSLPARIGDAVKRLQWPIARALFERYLAWPDRNPETTTLLAGQLRDWVTILNEEAAHLRRSGLMHACELEGAMLRRATLARRGLGLHEEA